MKRIAVFGLATLACFALAGAAGAQVTEGQGFMATPMSHGGISSANTQVESAAPPPAPPMPAPPPPPAKHRGHRHKAM